MPRKPHSTEEELKKAKSTVAKMVNKAGKTNKALAAAEEDRIRLAAEVNRLTSELEEKKTAIGELEGRLAQAEAAALEAETRHASEKTDLATRHAEETNQARADFEERLRAVATELDAVRTELANERASATNEIDQLEDVSLLLAKAHLAANNGTGRPKLAASVEFIEKAGDGEDLATIAAAVGFFHSALQAYAENDSSPTPAPIPAETEERLAVPEHASQR